MDQGHVLEVMVRERHTELLGHAERARLIRQSRVRRVGRCALALCRLGDLLIAVGSRLKARYGRDMAAVEGSGAATVVPWHRVRDGDPLV